MNNQVTPPDSAVMIKFHIDPEDRRRGDPLWGSDPLSIALLRVDEAVSGRKSFPCTAYLEIDPGQSGYDIDAHLALYCEIGDKVYSHRPDHVSAGNGVPDYMADARRKWRDGLYNARRDYSVWLHPVSKQ